MEGQKSIDVRGAEKNLSILRCGSCEAPVGLYQEVDGQLFDRLVDEHEWSPDASEEELEEDEESEEFPGESRIISLIRQAADAHKKEWSTPDRDSDISYLSQSQVICD